MKRVSSSCISEMEFPKENPDIKISSGWEIV